jgi:hypothetical protein
MKNHIYPLKFGKICTVAILLVITGISCVPAMTIPTSTPIFQTVEVTREVIMEVTR